MFPTNPPRRRGRPFGQTPLFLDDCFVRLDATVLLAKSRGALVYHPQEPARTLPCRWTLQWTEAERPQRRSVALAVTATGQHLGGVRRWWRCPMCGRRCRILLAVAPDAPIGC